MNKLDEMWAALEAHEPLAEYAEAWRRMLRERTEDAAWDASDAAEAAWAASPARASSVAADAAQRAIIAIREVQT